jgi:hypothetical protein
MHPRPLPVHGNFHRFPRLRAGERYAAAYLAALAEADDIIKRDPPRAARHYKALAKAPQGDAQLAAMSGSPTCNTA